MNGNVTDRIGMINSSRGKRMYGALGKSRTN
jgi:hypothetical protein